MDGPETITESDKPLFVDVCGRAPKLTHVAILQTVSRGAGGLGVAEIMSWNVSWFPTMN